MANRPKGSAPTELHLLAGEQDNSDIGPIPFHFRNVLQPHVALLHELCLQLPEDLSLNFETVATCQRQRLVVFPEDPDQNVAMKTRVLLGTDTDQKLGLAVDFSADVALECTLGELEVCDNSVLVGGRLSLWLSIGQRAAGTRFSPEVPTGACSGCTSSAPAFEVTCLASAPRVKARDSGPGQAEDNPRRSSRASAE